MRTKHVYAYVPEATRRAFDEYARACGITSKSELLSLLIVRELRLKRLPVGEQCRQTATKGRAKITSHLSTDLDTALTKRATDLGVTTSHAAARLVETELSERWLESALRWDPAA